MVKFLKKKVSTLVGMVIIFIAVGVFMGGAFTYQYFALKAFNKMLLTTGVLPAAQQINKVKVQMVQ